MARRNKRSKRGKQQQRKETITTLIENRTTVLRPDRSTRDVGKWKSALISADSGRMRLLFDLYAYVLTDGILSDAVSKRVDAVLNSPLQFLDKDGQEVEEITAIIDTVEFEKAIKAIMDNRFWGRSGFEIDFSNGFKVKPIKPIHIDIIKKQILIDPSQTNGIPYENDPFLLIVGEDKEDYGLLLKAAPYMIYKRGGYGDWSQWIELFGMPQRIGKYNAYDPQSKAVLESAMKNAGSAPYLVIPNDANVEMRDANKGSGTSYDQFRKANNEEMLITILGQTLTTTQGDVGARALGEVHKEVEEGKNVSDLRMVERVLNSQLVPMLEARGYNLKGGKFVYPRGAKMLTVAEYQQLSTLIDIPASHIHETFSIPEAAEGEPLAKARSAQSPATRPQATPTEPTKDSDKDDDKKDDDIENSDTFWTRFKDFFAAAPVNGAQSTGTAHITLSDDADDYDKLIHRVHTGESKRWDTELFQTTSKGLLNALQKVFKDQNITNADKTTIEATYQGDEQAMITAMEMNLYQFSAGKTLAQVGKLNSLLRESGGYSDFRKGARDVCKQFTEQWQRTEYDTALMAAQQAQAYHQQLQDADVMPYLRYCTVSDGKVREEHAKLEGTVLPINDPLWDEIYPPNGWNCRCWTEGVTVDEADPYEVKRTRGIANDYLSTGEWKKNKAGGWAINRGKRALVFEENQQYVKKKLLIDNLEKVKPDAWGVERTYKDRIKPSNPKADTSITNATDYWDKHAQGTELVHEDYAGRSWSMKKSDYIAHTTAKKAARVSLLGNVKDILKAPDEVWLWHERTAQKKSAKLSQLIMIRYYKDKAIACVCKSDKNKLSLKTWYEVDTDMVRKGILIKK